VSWSLSNTAYSIYAAQRNQVWPEQVEFMAKLLGTKRELLKGRLNFRKKSKVSITELIRRSKLWT
jgi:hypothetical protein